MNALVIEAPGVAGFAVRPEPEIGPGDVMLKVRRVGYCGSDLNTFRGFNPMVSFPRIPGHELAAEVVGKGAAVPPGISLGEIVTALPYTSCGACSACRANRANACRSNQTLGVQRDGALAEFIALPWQKIVAAPGLGELELALVEPLSVGFHAVDRGRVAAGETVVVFGCGMIGLGAIASAGLDRGARVIAVDIDDGKLALARRCGAAETINSAALDVAQAVADLTGGEGADAVIEAVGLPQTFVASIGVAAFAGRVVYIGYAKKEVAYETKYFVMKELDIRGSRNATAADFDRVISLLGSSRYPSRATVTREVPFAESADALRSWSDDPSTVTKIQILF